MVRVLKQFAQTYGDNAQILTERASHPEGLQVFTPEFTRVIAGLCDDLAVQRLGLRHFIWLRTQFIDKLRVERTSNALGLFANMTEYRYFTIPVELVVVFDEQGRVIRIYDQTDLIAPRPEAGPTEWRIFYLATPTGVE